MVRFVGLSINKGKGGGARKKAEPFTRATGISTDSSNHVTEVTLGDTKYTKMYYNNVGLVTGFNETISGSRKGWILEYDSEGLVTSIEQRIPPHPNPSYNLTASTTTITENATVTFNLSLFDITDGTFYWRAEGTNITTADFTGGAITGSVTTSGGSAQISLTTAEDVAIEGIESFEMKIYSDSGYTSLVATSPTVTISDTSIPTFSITASTTSITENATVTFDVTTNAPDGTTLYWKADGSNVTTSDFTGGAITGSVATSGGSAQISLTTAEDSSSGEGNESFAMKIYTDSGYTNLVATSETVSITDTSFESALYAFTTFTFKTHLPYGANTAGNYPATGGYEGSTYSQLTSMSHYQNNGAAWYNDTNLFRMNTRGYQEWKVPATGNYKIKCMGAGGGLGSQGSGIVGRGGYGSYTEKTFALNKGDWLQIIVGHCGGNSPTTTGSGGGGGGSFVLKSTTGSFSTTNLILAGGGGGGGSHVSQTYADGADGGLTSISGEGVPFVGTGQVNRPAGTYGAGGGYSVSVGDWGGGDGAGFLTNGYSSEYESGSSSTTGMGRSYNNGMLGGNGYPFSNNYGHNGGFGGGGASSWAPGGGGGYSGGPGDYSAGSGSGTEDSGPNGAGSGGLYYIGNTPTIGNNTIVDHGYVEVTKVA